MPSISPPLMNLNWSLWKANWQDVLATAALSAGLEAGAFSLFLYMFIQNPSRVLPVVGGTFSDLLVLSRGHFRLARQTHQSSSPFGRRRTDPLCRIMWP